MFRQEIADLSTTRVTEEQEVAVAYFVSGNPNWDETTNPENRQPDLRQQRDDVYRAARRAGTIIVSSLTDRVEESPYQRPGLRALIEFATGHSITRCLVADFEFIGSDHDSAMFWSLMFEQMGIEVIEARHRE